MGDENSLAGTTKAHKHTSPASDGGFLETTETGVTNMSQGSIGYYDGSSVLTELTAGNSADVLTMGATNPAWSAPAAAVVGFDYLGTKSGGDWSANQVTYDLSGATNPYDFLIGCLYLDDSAGFDPFIRMGNGSVDTVTGHYGGQIYDGYGAGASAPSTDKIQVGNDGVANKSNTWFMINNTAISQNTLTSNSIKLGSGTAYSYFWQAIGVYNDLSGNPMSDFFAMGATNTINTTNSYAMLWGKSKA